jgi:hypothetical protein
MITKIEKEFFFKKAKECNWKKKKKRTNNNNNNNNNKRLGAQVW